MKSDHLDQNPAKSPGNVASVKVYQDTWDQLDESILNDPEIMELSRKVIEKQESLMLMTESERTEMAVNFIVTEWDDMTEKEYLRGAKRAKLCRIADPDCEACQ